MSPVVDLLDAAWLSAASGRPVQVWQETDSTNRLGREAARALLATGAPQGPLPVFVAEHQQAGRGRLGRTWAAAPGENLLFSVLLAPRLPLAQAPRAVLAWAAAMAEVLELGIKWPNDLVDDADQKLGGILAEHEPGEDPARVGILVLGVGINCRQREFPDLPQASSLALLRGQAPARGPLLVELLAAIDRVDPASPHALETWRARSRTLGRRVRVAGREGLATGLREDGALLVDGQPVLAGDVQLVAAPARPPTAG